MMIGCTMLTTTQNRLARGWDTPGKAGNQNTMSVLFLLVNLSGKLPHHLEASVCKVMAGHEYSCFDECMQCVRTRVYILWPHVGLCNLPFVIFPSAHHNTK